MLRYLTCGESHGEALMAILEGIPAGLKLDASEINLWLKRRQEGPGRGARMKIEKDTVNILSGTRKGLTIGSPIGMMIKNKDFSINKLPDVFAPRPAHADLAGFLKYGTHDMRDILERASARETASRVAVGAVCATLLEEFGVKIKSNVAIVGGESRPKEIPQRIKEAYDKGDTVGGIFQVQVSGVIPGLGSHVQPDRKLDARICAQVMSIPGIKAIGFGLGFAYGHCFGSECHDPILYSNCNGYYRCTNNAGGIEGGISNGEDIVFSACMKPIATLAHPLASVDVRTKKPCKANVQRSDTCAVHAAAVVAEAACAFVLAGAFLEKFGADNLKDIKQAFLAYRKKIC
ncbi:MAG: chorismate synthase [Candidatus Omnitrophica bacterium]|jgi:chorismate synthase|nr:chorismate synthase [Candidatus Omnitrophota bacterium]